MRARSRRVILTAALAVGVAACQTTAQGAVREAVVLDDNEAVITTVKAVLEDAIREGRVNLGPSDLKRDSIITVLPSPPGPYEGNSPAMPRYFELVTDGKNCFIRERGEKTLRALAGVRCRVK